MSWKENEQHNLKSTATFKQIVADITLLEIVKLNSLPVETNTYR